MGNRDNTAAEQLKSRTANVKNLNRMPRLKYDEHFSHAIKKLSSKILVNEARNFI